MTNKVTGKGEISISHSDNPGEFINVWTIALKKKIGVQLVIILLPYGIEVPKKLRPAVSIYIAVVFILSETFSRFKLCFNYL